ncbi:MAG: ASCH domain-containing protein [Candidatus Woesearchaeota archaeon]
MDHVAILAKKRKLLQKIISGEKTIESRWYKFRKAPYRSIAVGDVVYFKDSGDPVIVKARVADVLFFAELDREIFDSIISEYGSRICIDSSFWNSVKDKKLCTLIFLKDVETIEPFNIDKKGFGMMVAWLSVDSIDKIKI